MTTTAEPYLEILDLCPFGHSWFRDKLEAILADRSALPSFSATTIKLMHATQDPDAAVEDLEKIIGMDPGLGTQCIRASNTIEYSRRQITSVEQALHMLGLARVGEIAVSAGMMNRFHHLRANVDWNCFWLHNLLVARLTESIAKAFRSTNGSEYLAGLLHDVGKLILEHYFPTEFETVIAEANRRQLPHFQVELETLGMSHAQIGGAMCLALGVNQRVAQAVQFHHDPLSEASIEAPLSMNGFLATCVSVANVAAKLVNSAFESNAEVPRIDELPEWEYLAQFDRYGELDIDVWKAREKAEQDMLAMVS